MKVRTGVIWSLALICSLVLSANLFVAKESEKYRRLKTEEVLVLSQEAKISLNRKLRETLSEKELLGRELVAEKEWSGFLKGQLTEKQTQIDLALSQIEEKELKIAELLEEVEVERKLRVDLEKFLEDKKDELVLAKQVKEDLEKSSGEVTVELERIVIKSTSRLQGKVIAVNREYNFVVIDLGKAHDLKGGEVLSVYRQDEFVGRVQIEKLREEISAASILPEWESAEFNEDDIVKNL